MGIPGVEYFAHPLVMGPRFAKEFLFTGDRINADRAPTSSAWSTGWCRARSSPSETIALAERIARCRASAWR